MHDSTETVPCIKRIGSNVAWERVEDNSQTLQTDIADAVGVYLSSIDPEPYEWYEPDGDIIKASHFRTTDGVIKTGIHDQSVFVFNLSAICKQLESYMEVLGLNDEEDYINKEVSKEMKLLNSFTYFYENNLLPMKYSLIESGRSYSFNTQEELEAIRSRVK